MRFWVFTGKAAAGPFGLEGLRRLPGFGPGVFVAPEGASTEDAWKPARDFPELRPLFAAAPAPRAARPSQAAKPAPVRPASVPRPAASGPAAPKKAPVRPRPRPRERLAAAFRGRGLQLLAIFAGAGLLAAVLHSVFAHLGERVSPPPPADKRPMAFEAPGSPLLKKLGRSSGAPESASSEE